MGGGRRCRWCRRGRRGKRLALDSSALRARQSARPGATGSVTMDFLMRALDSMAVDAVAERAVVPARPEPLQEEKRKAERLRAEEVARVWRPSGS